MHQPQIEPQAQIDPQILDAAKEVFAARRSLTLAAQRERVETRAACACSPGDVRRELDRKLLAAAGLEDGELERARSEYLDVTRRTAAERKAAFAERLPRDAARAARPVVEDSVVQFDFANWIPEAYAVQIEESDGLSLSFTAAPWDTRVRFDVAWQGEFSHSEWVGFVFGWQNTLGRYVVLNAEAGLELSGHYYNAVGGGRAYSGLAVSVSLDATVVPPLTQLVHSFGFVDPLTEVYDHSLRGWRLRTRPG